MKHLEVYDLPAVDNVCNQTLREVISLPKVSVAHVLMHPGGISLPHHHQRMSEIYFILEGEGIIYYKDQALHVEQGAYLVLPPYTSHQLKNIGKNNLEHLVLAVPPFSAKDVILDNVETGNTDNSKTKPQKFTFPTPVTALDGATIYELIPEAARKELDVGLAVGILPPNQKAIPHYHNLSEEVYYIIGGQGKARVGGEELPIKRGTVIPIPTKVIHSLENTNVEELNVLCLSSPAYVEGDFIIADTPIE